MDALASLLPYVIISFVVILPLFGAAVKIVQEDERGVIFRLGRPRTVPNCATVLG